MAGGDLSEKKFWHSSFSVHQSSRNGVGGCGRVDCYHLQRFTSDRCPTVCPFLSQLATFACVLCCCSFLALIIRWVGRKNRSYGSGFQQSLADLTSVVQEGYRGQRMVKIYDAYEYEQKRFMSANGLMRRLALRMQRVSGAGTPLTHLSACVR